MTYWINLNEFEQTILSAYQNNYSTSTDKFVGNFVPFSAAVANVPTNLCRNRFFHEISNEQVFPQTFVGTCVPTNLRWTRCSQERHTLGIPTLEIKTVALFHQFCIFLCYNILWAQNNQEWASYCEYEMQEPIGGLRCLYSFH